MRTETKIYSEFIKRNNVKVTSWGYEFRGEDVRVYKSESSKFWYSELCQDNCYTKKSCIYFCLKTRYNVTDGIIGDKNETVTTY